ncbi:MAG: 16S rRNA (uracil(1498)-N(3))-methyltransferase [Actinomycetaceae bacterium]|nr:16S rRNA (uracil(1498)-N(3))-methyltransferase [Actinomycetaceae bacterium]
MSVSLFLADRDLIEHLGVPLSREKLGETLQPQDTIRLTGDEARHIATVFRAKVGEVIDVCDGQGVVVRCEVLAGVSKNSVELLVLEVNTRPRRAPAFALVQGLAKGGRDEQAVETATELGVDQIIPWQAGRSVSVWADAKRAEKGRGKWQEVARASSKQSRRAYVPEVLPAMDTKALAEWINDEVKAGAVAIILHEEASESLTSTLRKLPGGLGETVPKIIVVIGPEGGIGIDEQRVLEVQGCVSAKLGENILRTSSAGPAALVVSWTVLGLW